MQLCPVKKSAPVRARLRTDRWDRIASVRPQAGSYGPKSRPCFDFRASVRRHDRADGIYSQRLKNSGILQGSRGLSDECDPPKRDYPYTVKSPCPSR